jgi:leucyl-tRNA synthetase
MSEYKFREIEQKWDNFWQENQTFSTNENSGKEPYYVLDMFPYPSGAGLHVGHPLGYIASDIIARYKRHRGFEVLHPMGYDAFGLPAEQYAIDTGNHPAQFTDQNISRYREQLKSIGLSYDWSRELKTSDPEYYKWTQLIFIEFFNSWYDLKKDKAQSIERLIEIFNTEGNQNLKAFTNYELKFTGKDWIKYTEPEKEEILQHYRLAYLAESEVNWCPALGTILANEEVRDGVSERGGYPVERKKMRQWFLRITAYAERLLDGLTSISWPEAIKEVQINWIGKSVGAEVFFEITNLKKDISSKTSLKIKIFTTRPDTIFGSTFLVIAPEHEIIQSITTEDQKAQVLDYIEMTSSKTDRNRMAESSTPTGVFSGSYAINPFNGRQIPIWIADYVLADYGSGAIMAVPAHDSRDWSFARQYKLPIEEVVAGGNIEREAFESKTGVLINSDFLNGLTVNAANQKAIEEIERRDIGKAKIQYRLRDANFSRQRYWGEPIPIIYQNGIPHTINKQDLPVKLPEISVYKPNADGQSPLSRAKDWINTPDGKREINTMPGWAGSSWYFLRYMDPHNKREIVSYKREQFWKNVNFYIGGAEHATGHLLYARFWQKFLFDKGITSTDEPFEKLVNQGMIMGRSSLAYRLKGSNTFISKNLVNNRSVTEIHIDVNIVENDVLNIEKFRAWRPEFANAEFELENEKYICGYVIEKMSKRWYNVVTPDAIIEKFGCDAFRMYEMFLGPVEQSKPWNTEGIDGVTRFLKKFWGLFYNSAGGWQVEENVEPTSEELKILHKTIKRVTEDIERFNLNTCISTFMIAVNELNALKRYSRSILEPLVILLSPFAPHISEEIWRDFGYDQTIAYASWPEFVEKYIIESTFEYPISINGKVRTKIQLPLDMPVEQIKLTVLENEIVKKWIENTAVKKIIVVPGKIVNLVI